MSLKYRFRHLFYGNRFHKERMWETLEDLDARITALEESNSTPSNNEGSNSDSVTPTNNEEDDSSSSTPSDDNGSTDDGGT